MKVYQWCCILFFIFLFPLAAHPSFSNLSAVRTIPAGASPRGIATGNVTDKSAIDLLVADFGTSTFIGQNTPVSMLNLSPSVVQIFVPSPLGLQLLTSFQTGASPRGIAAFDLNGSGLQSVLVTAYDANLLQVFQWQNGQFHKVDEQPTLSMPVGLAAGTTRVGGTPLVAVADYGANDVSLFPVKNGKLGPRLDVPVSSGPVQAVIADLKGDGKNEIAVACLTANKIDILENAAESNGDDSSDYRVDQSLALPDGSHPSALVAVDINGDGKTDLVCANYFSNTLTVFLQQNGGILSALAPVTASGNHPNGMVAADLYGDGKKEIIVANRDSDSLDIFEWSGNQLNLAQTLKTADDAVSLLGPVEVAALDTRRQGVKDLIVSHMRSNSIKVLAQDVFSAPSPTATLAFNKEGEGTPFAENTTFAFPNPSFGGTIKFSFNLSAPSEVTFRVFEMTGNLVWTKTLGSSQTKAGTNQVDWSECNQAGQSLASGLYLYQINVGTQRFIKKLVIMH